MIRSILRTAAASLLLLSALIVPTAAASQKYLANIDFENQKTGKAPATIGAISTVPLAGTITVDDLNGNKVLAFRRTTANGNTAAYVDILTGSKGFAASYCLSYDIMIPEKLSSAGTWQVACSRQVPPAGNTQFQQTGTLNLSTGSLTDKSEVAVLEFGKWYNISVVFNETDSKYDIYLDGRLIVDASPYSIDTSAKYPERLRIGQNQSTGDCLVYVDNVKVYNAAIPESIAAPDIQVLAAAEQAEESAAVFDLPVWTHQYDVNTIVVVAVGSASILLVLVLAAIILKKGRAAR